MCKFAAKINEVIYMTLIANYMDNNIKIKIDEVVAEISKINDLSQKIAILDYMEQQSSYMLWLLQDEEHIDHDANNV
jgi:hypothetical protein